MVAADVRRPVWAEWPLVGREPERVFVLESIRANAGGVVIAGVVGVGKTRLASSAGQHLADEGWEVRRFIATEARRTIPFAPFAALLDQADDSVEPFQRLRMATAALGAAGASPVLLHVDDAQFLDDQSWAFLEHVAEMTEVRVLLTARVTDPQMHRVAAFARAYGLAHLQLQPLSRVEVAALVQEVLPGVSSRESRALWDMTHGNPLYVHEVVVRAQERGDALDVAGDGLSTVVGDRLEHLDGVRRAVLELLAVGGEVAVALLRQRSSDAVLVDLEERGLLAVHESGRRLVATLAHPIYGEVVSAQLGVVARRSRRRELLDGLSRHGARRQSDLVQIAVWGVEQGDDVDPGVLIGVARRLSGYSHESTRGSADALPRLHGDLLTIAARLAHAATEHGGGFEAASTWFGIEAHLDGESAATAEALAHMGRLASTPEEEAFTTTAAASLHLFNGWQTPPEVIAELQEAQQGVAGAARRSVDAVLAMTMSAFGRYQDAADLGQRVLDDPATSPRDRLVVVAPVIGSLAVLGHLVEALALSDRALAEIPPDPDPWSLGALMFVRVAVLRANGRIGEADELAAAVVVGAEAVGNHLGVALFGLAVAETAIARGRPRDALAATAAAIASGSDHDGRPSDRAMAHVFSAQAHALLGQREQAAAALDRADLGRLRTHVYRSLDARARAWVLAADGRHRAAVALLRETIEDDPENRHGAMGCLHDLARLGEHGAGVEMQALLDGGVDGDHWAVCTAHAVAFDAGDGARLDVAAAALAEMGLTLVAAEAAAQAADAHHAAGARSAGNASRARSAVLEADCQGACTPALAAAGAAVRSLTARELEVARLAARGATSREIAADASLSVRTVETYLYRIYFKLGVEGRADLADLPGL